MQRLPVLRPILTAGTLALLAWALTEYIRPSVLLVGNVTIDVVDKSRALGGAVAYSAAVLSAFGIRACVVTDRTQTVLIMFGFEIAGDGNSELPRVPRENRFQPDAAAEDADLSAFKGHNLHLVKSNATLVFEHTYTWWGNKRKLRVLAQPNVTLTWEHVPLQCRRAKTVLLGPLTPQDMDCKSFVQQRLGWLDKWTGFHQHIGFMAQGLQRDLDATKKVVPKREPSPLLTEALGPEVYVFLSDVETDVWANGTVAGLSERSARWLITRGEAGADEFSSGSMQHLPPHKVDAVADTNGAGDTFATAYMLALASGWPSPGSFANWAASRAVMMPQACKPHCVQQGLHANSTFAQVAKWLSHQVQHAEEETKEMIEVAQGGFEHALNFMHGGWLYQTVRSFVGQFRKQDSST